MFPLFSSRLVLEKNKKKEKESLLESCVDEWTSDSSPPSPLALRSLVLPLYSSLLSFLPFFRREMTVREGEEQQRERERERQKAASHLKL